jgi:predicted nucleic acid-binding Zn ribbon protein
MKHIKDFVQELATKSQKQASQAWQQQLFQHWPDAIGKLSRRMRIEYIRDNLLIIGVYDVHWMHELYMMTADIRDRINIYLGDDYVYKIQFKIAKKRRKPAVAENKQDVFHVERRDLSETQKSKLQVIDDVGLAQALTSFWSRCH